MSRIPALTRRSDVERNGALPQTRGQVRIEDDDRAHLLSKKDDDLGRLQSGNGSSSWGGDGDYSRRMQKREQLLYTLNNDDDFAADASVANRGIVNLRNSRRQRLLIVFTFLGFLTRFWDISHPGQVVFDEVHFGGFASKYIRRTYFFDLHPPVAKLMITFAAWIMGYNGEFTFKEIGMDYASHDNVYVPYVAMRSVTALCGTLLVPVTFMTSMELGMSTIGASLATVLVLVEPIFITQSRLILLDSILLIFIALTAFARARFANLRRRPWSAQWKKWMALQGLFIALALGSKWVGLFVMALVGFHTIADLWFLLGDLRLSLADWTEHFTIRLGTLIILPIIGYIIPYWIHLMILDTTGPGIGFHRNDFAKGLKTAVYENSDMIEMEGEITFQHFNPNLDIPSSPGGRKTPEAWKAFLHSHSSNYPHTNRQQVTAYGFTDMNNFWSLHDGRTEEEKRVQEADYENRMKDIWALHPPKSRLHRLEYFMNDSIVRLEHTRTKLNLYAYDYDPPITKGDGKLMLSCNPGKGHRFKIVVDMEKTAKALADRLQRKSEKDRVDYLLKFIPESKLGEMVTKAGTTDFERVIREGDPTIRSNLHRFQIVLHGQKEQCAVMTHRVQLPAWGWNQYETLCTTDLTDPNTFWKVDESNRFRFEDFTTLPPQNPDRNTVFRRLLDIVELQIINWNTNQNLSSEHYFGSRPWSWPILRRGISFWQDKKAHQQIYLLGNVFTFYLILGAVGLYFFAGMLYLIRWRRGYQDLTSMQWARYTSILTFSMLGWFLHWAPFNLMHRQLFLHHYLPAHWFAILAFAGIFEHFTTVFLKSQLHRLYFAGAISFMALCTFWFLSPLTYGSTVSHWRARHMQIFSTWDIETYPDDGHPDDYVAGLEEAVTD
eukprot:Clim_evm9s144 gene=Clim_evmTU9s144